MDWIKKDLKSFTQQFTTNVLICFPLFFCKYFKLLVTKKSQPKIAAETEKGSLL